MVTNTPRHFRFGWIFGAVLRAAILAVLIGVLLYAAYIVFFLAVIYPQTATVRLENDSDGRASFYVDGKYACGAASNTYCNVQVRVYKSHDLSATTYYDGGQMYNTPPVVLSAKNGEVYRYMACGMSGNPGTNCGLFGVDTVPATY
jgi:hypothetical protein